MGRRAWCLIAAAACWASCCGAAALGTAWFDRPVVIGGRGLESTWFATPLLVAGAVLVVAGVCVPARQRGPRAVRSLRVVVAALLLGGSGAAAVYATGLSWLLDAGATTTVLSPPSPSGCRVVVRESAPMTGGVGARLFLLPPGAHRAERIGVVALEGVRRPSEQGEWRVRWDDGGVAVSAAGQPGAGEVRSSTGAACRTANARASATLASQPSPARTSALPGTPSAR